MKPILCLDFDGVIHWYRSGWQSGAIYDPPTPGFLDWLMKAKDVFKVVIYSSRSKDPKMIEAMGWWLKKHLDEGGYDTVALLSALSFAATKPAAFLTIDDRALTFNGNWTDYPVEKLLAFKPWNVS